MMAFNQKQIQFLLVPDASAGRHVRQQVAAQDLGFGVKVGTWLELVEEARLMYLFPPLVVKE
jgi:hypothetical protein